MGRFYEDLLIKIGLHSSGQNSHEWGWSVSSKIDSLKIEESSFKDILNTIESLKKYLQKKLLDKQKEENGK